MGLWGIAGGGVQVRQGCAFSNTSLFSYVGMQRLGSGRTSAGRMLDDVPGRFPLRVRPRGLLQVRRGVPNPCQRQFVNCSSSNRCLEGTDMMLFGHCIVSYYHFGLCICISQSYERGTSAVRMHAHSKPAWLPVYRLCRLPKWPGSKTLTSIQLPTTPSLSHWCFTHASSTRDAARHCCKWVEIALKSLSSR